MQNKVATIGLVAFLAIDVALVALALRPGRPGEAEPATGTPTAVVTTTGAASSTKTPATTGTSTGTATAVARTAAGTRGAAHRGARRDDRLARRRRAAVTRAARPCPSLPTGARRGTRPRRPPAPSSASSRSTRTASSRSPPAPTASSSSTPATTGATRGRRRRPSPGGWARQLDEPTEVLTPQDDRAQPCGPSTAVVDLSRTSASQAQALCVDGSVTVTSDGGETWADAGTVKGGLALGNRLESGRLTTYVARVARRLRGHRPRAGRQGQRPPERRLHRHERAAEGWSDRAVDRRRGGLAGRGRHGLDRPGRPHVVEAAIARVSTGRHW